MPRAIRFSLCVIALALATGCQRERPVSTTISPAPPRPSPQNSISTIGRTPEVTTSGSPAPWADRHESLEHVTEADDSVQVRALIPRMNTAFEFTNRGKVEHALVLSSPGQTIEVPPLTPGQSTFLAVTLTEKRYTVSCRTPGHREQASFRTYVPGRPIPRR